MPGRMKQGQSIFIPFKNGESIYDSQNKARMYMSEEKFRASFPGWRFGEVDLVEYVPKPRWTSVEERLPDAEQEVRVLCKASWNSCYRYQCQAFYEPKGMLRENSNYGWDYECCNEYSEEDDDYFVNPGWYERIHNWDDYSAVGITDEVTHWMPLPEPPKEEV